MSFATCIVVFCVLFAFTFPFCLLGLVVLWGCPCEILTPFTRGKNVCVLLESCCSSRLSGGKRLRLVRVMLLVPSVLGENVCVLFESCFSSRLFWEKTSASCSSHAPRPVCRGRKSLRLVRVMLLVPSAGGEKDLNLWVP